jgi:hypothetical protein
LIFIEHLHELLFGFEATGPVVMRALEVDERQEVVGFDDPFFDQLPNAGDGVVVVEVGTKLRRNRHADGAWSCVETGG